MPNGGDVQLTTTEVDQCTIDSWGYSPANVGVDCYDPSGALTNASFTVLVTQPKPTATGVLDYVWAWKYSGKLTGLYQYNSSHKTNSISRLGIGRFLVTMPGPATPKINTGTVKVSAYGTAPGDCQIAAWKQNPTATAQLIYVDCFTPAGARQDRQFTVLYARNNNLMGENGYHDANALANGTADLYQPAVQFDSNRGARVSIVHLGPGIYQILLIGTPPTTNPIGGFGDVQLTAVNAAPRLCVISYEPLRVPFMLVQCENQGHAANSPFMLQWVVR
jgi:hypothetical protein